VTKASKAAAEARRRKARGEEITSLESGQSMADLKESFWLYGKDGSMHRAHIYQNRIATSDTDGPSSKTGLTTVLQDGTQLNYVDENTFKNAVTGELLSRTKP
jgi:hypothetical protein